MSSSYKIRNPDGLYFITFAVVGWIDIFTRAEYKEILIDSIRYCQEKKGLKIHAWCIMTNHVHLIISKGSEFELNGIIRDMKKFTSKEIFKAIEKNNGESRRNWILAIFKNAGKFNSNNTYFQLWQQDYHPIELYSNDVIKQKLNYIHNNPVKAGIVERAEDFIHSSARDYAGIKGLLKIDFLTIYQ